MSYCKQQVNRRILMTGVAAALLFGAALTHSAGAQERVRGSAVIFPVVFARNSGDETSRKTAIDSVEESLQKGGYSLISRKVAANTWRRMALQMPSGETPANTTDIVRFGAALKARYVVSAVFDFHSRSIWVDLGPRTVSSATVDIVITDVAQGKTVYSRENVMARSDEKFDLAKAGADLLMTPLVTIVSGGPKTPHEQRAVQIAVARAMHGWIRADDDDYDHKGL